MAHATARADVHPANLALIDRFEVWEHKRNLAEKTIQGRRMRLQSLAHHLGRSLLEATADDVDAWLHTRNAPTGLAPQTFEAYLRMVRAFYQWALRERLVEKDPTGDVVRPRLPRPLPRPMDPGDLVRALEAADDRKAAMLALVAYAGLRCHEVAALRVREANAEHGCAQFAIFDAPRRVFHARAHAPGVMILGAAGRTPPTVSTA